MKRARVGSVIVSGIALVSACGGQPAATATAARTEPAAIVAPSHGPLDADATATEDVTVATPPTPPPAPPPPRVILHAGDSMVGGNGGLAQALYLKFKPFGTTYVRDWRVATVQTFDYGNYFGKLLDKHHPDMVILNLGANDVFVPFPKSLARFVAAIAAKATAEGRTCWWITPPLWKPPDSGIVAVIKANATGCHVFDSSDLVLPKWGDGIHPTNEGGTLWADAFWVFYERERGLGPIPTAGALVSR